jgi:hypothetical protein
VSCVSAAEEVSIEVFPGRRPIRCRRGKSEHGCSLIAVHLVDRGRSGHDGFVGAADCKRTRKCQTEEIIYLGHLVDEVFLLGDSDMRDCAGKVVVTGAVAFVSEFDETVPRRNSCVLRSQGAGVETCIDFWSSAGSSSVALGDNGKVLLRKKFSQKQLITFTANLQTSLIDHTFPKLRLAPAVSVSVGDKSPSHSSTSEGSTCLYCLDG